MNFKAFIVWFLLTIADKSGVGYSTLKLLMPKLKKKGFVKVREVGKAKLYQINLKNRYMGLFKKFYWDISSPKR